MRPEAWVALARGMEARRNKQPGEARAAFAEAAEIARKSNDPAGLATALAKQAQIELDAGLFDAALALQQQSVAIRRTLNDPPSLAHAVRHVGDILQAAGRHVEADGFYAEMLALYRATTETPPLDMANAVRSAALHAQNLGRTDEARRLWLEARDRYAALDNLFLSPTGKVENAGVKEADRRLAALSG